MVLSLSKSEKYYLLPDEEDAYRTCKNKNYIPKIMFLCVVARPRFRDGTCIFDGRIGCFPLVRYEPAMRGNGRTGRIRGDMIMKPITSITREVIREFMTRAKAAATPAWSPAPPRWSPAPSPTPAKAAATPAPPRWSPAPSPSSAKASDEHEQRRARAVVSATGDREQ